MLGILTFQKTTNFGAALQIYALTNTIDQFDKKYEVIQYHNETIEQTENYFFLKEKSFENIVRLFVLGVPNLISQRKFKKFVEKFINMSEKKYYKENIVESNRIYNNFIVGSDQVWNHRLTGNDTTYYLDFVKNIERRNSYAASFGINDTFNQSNVLEICGYLKQFNVLSVREQQAVEDIKKFTGRNPSLVLDPTFLLTKNEWVKLCLNSKYQRKKRKYILVYMPRKREEVIPRISEFASKNNLEVRYVTDNYLKYRNTKRITTAGPEDFVSLLMNADYVFSGSYHGFILSLNFNKPVLVEYDKNGVNFNSRLESIISEFDLEDLVYSRGEIRFSNTDYTEFNLKLSERRAESLKILRSIIDD